MKRTISKVISVICAAGIALNSCIAALAAENYPSAEAVMSNSGKTAEISVITDGTQIYSAQVTLRINGNDMKFEIESADKGYYSATTQTDDTVTLYVDSTELMKMTADGKGQKISLANISANKKMQIGDTADIILIDRSMKSHEYDNVKVNVRDKAVSSTPTPKPSSSGGGGGGGGGIASVIKPPQSVTTPIMPTAAPNSGEQGSEQGGVRFNDINAHWAKDDILYVTERGLFDGTSDDTFEPDVSMTRAMYVTVLSRFGDKLSEKWSIACDSPAVFDDIPAGQWYSDAVAWAGGTGLVTGVGDNCFAPDQAVTREQMAVMIVNFARLCNIELPSKAEETEFADGYLINDWASGAVRDAQKAGIISGREDGTFAPQDTATRAEVSAIIHRLVTILN